MIKKHILLFLLVSFMPLTLKAQTPCTLAPSVQQMDHEFINWLQSSIQNQSMRIAILPFQDGSQIDVDPAMEKGFSLILYDFIKQVSDTAVFHPYVLWHAIETQKITSADLFSDAKALELAQQIKATHVIYGMFQKQPNNTIRYFIKISDVTQQKSLGPLVESYTQQTDSFFVDISKSVQELLNRLGKKSKAPSFKKYLETSPSFEAYRYYIKGMLKSQSYQETDLKIAKAWFDKAVSLSYHFTSAFHEKARSLFMLALIQKQMGKDAAVSIGEATYILKQYPLAAQEKKKKNKDDSLPSAVGTYRWLNAHLHFVSGVSLLQNSQFAAAQRELKSTVQLLPEDGLAHFYLSEANQQTGQGQTQEEKNLALQLNPCLK